MFPGQPLTIENVPPGDSGFEAMSRRCHDASGFNPLDAEHSGRHLTESIRLQMFGTTLSLYRYELLLLQHGSPDIIAEHSMGIYSALAASGSIDCSAALELTFRIGVCLASMGGEKNYALGSVIGLSGDLLNAIVANNGVFIANHNTSRHFLLSGEMVHIRAAALEAENAGAFSTGIFHSDAPLHTPLVAEISAGLQAIVSDYSYRTPRIPLIDHHRQRRLTSDDIPVFLVEQLSHPVFWDTTFKLLQSEGVTQYYEAGVGQTLSKFNRWIESDL